MEPYQIREDFIRYGIRKTIKKNHYLLDPTVDDSSLVYFLDQGIAALTHINEEGVENIYLYFCEKRLIGFVKALLHYFPYDWEKNIAPAPFWILAKTDCVYYAMHEKQFDELMNSSHGFTQGVLGAAALNYLELVDKLQCMLSSDKTTQFCQCLLDYHVKKYKNHMFSVDFSFVDAANYLGMHPVTASRIASRLRELGIIGRENGELVIKDEERLRAMAVPRPDTFHQ